MKHEDLVDLFDSATYVDLDPAEIASLEESADRQLAREISAAARLIALADGLPAARVQPGVRPRVLTVLHSCLPWLPGGYSGRAHGLLSHFVAEGIASLPLTRPTFLGDMRSGLTAKDHPRDRVDHVVYQHIDGTPRRVQGEYQYMEASISVYARLIQEFEPTVMHLRSSYPSALPALIAARQLGVPCLYEVSGLWELVYEGRGQSASALRARTLEAVTMRNADSVVTLTTPMKRLIESDYAPQQTVTLAPNAVDAHRFRPSPARARDEPLVLGYVGSLLDYEGIDLLVEAIAIARQQGHDVRGLVVGGGSELNAIRRLVAEHGLGEIVEVTGPVDPVDVPSFYHRIDVCPLPRRSTPATETVSPLKPFEALAMAKPLIVSDVEALSEIANASQAALIFRAGDATDLARRIVEFSNNYALRNEMGARGRRFIEDKHTWSVVGHALLSELNKCATGENYGGAK